MQPQTAKINGKWKCPDKAKLSPPRLPMISSPLLMLCECSWLCSGQSHRGRAIQSNAMSLVSKAEPWSWAPCSTSGEQRWGWDPIQPRAWLQSPPAIQEVIEDNFLLVNQQLAPLFAPSSKYSFKAALTSHCSLLMCCYCK